MPDPAQRHPSAPAVAIVVSRYNDAVTRRLEAGAREAYLRRGGEATQLGIIDAPGAYELVALADAAARSGMYRGVCALGCIVKGQTRHDEYLAHAVAQGLMRITLDRQVPVAFGVLTVEEMEQAIARAGGDEGNKGAEAMAALLDTLAGIDAISQASSPGAVTPTIVREIAKLGARTDDASSGGALS